MFEEALVMHLPSFKSDHRPMLVKMHPTKHNRRAS